MKNMLCGVQKPLELSNTLCLDKMGGMGCFFFYIYIKKNRDSSPNIVKYQIIKLKIK
jgi:hypothetical protein